MAIPRCSAYHPRKAAGSLARKKTPPTPTTASPTDPLPRPPDELCENIAMRAQLRDALVLALGRVRRRHCEKGRRTDLLGDGKDPLDQRRDARPRRDDITLLEVGQPVRQSVPDRAPQVLLDKSVRQVGQRLSLVERPCEARRQRVDQR